MAVTARFLADFSSFQQAVQKAELTLKGFESEAGRAEKALNRIGDSFSGRKVIQDAELMTKAIGEIGGASRLTESEQRRVNSAITEALAKYKALGLEAPKAMTDLAAATKKVEAATATTFPKTGMFAESLGGLEKGGRGGSLAMDVLTGTFGKFTAAGVAIGVVNKLGGALAEMAQQGTQLAPIQDAFNRLSAGVGENSDRMLDSMQVATRGMVTNFDLMQSANKALLLGLPTTTESMASLAKMSTVLGKAMGQDATKSLDDMIVALGRSSPMILDNLGLTVKVEEANQKYAAALGKTVDELTELEQKEAFRNEALKKGAERVAQIGEQSLTLTEHAKTVVVTLSNVVVGAIGAVDRAAGEMITKGEKAIASAGKAFSRPFGADDFDTDALNQALQSFADVSAPAAKGTDDLAAKAKRLTDGLGLLTKEQLANIKAGKLLGLSNKEIATSMEAAIGKVKVTEALLNVFDKTTRETTKTKKEQAQIDKEIFEGMRKYGDMLFKTDQLLQKANNSLHDSIREHTVEKEVISATIPDEITWKWRDYTGHVEEHADTLKHLANLQGGEFKDSQTEMSRIIDLATRSLERQSAAMQSGLNFGKKLSQSIIGAFQGGGDIGKTIGATLGDDIGSALGEKLAKAIGGKLGGAIGGVLGPLGAIGGELLGGLVGKLFGKGEGRSMVEDFAKQFGGFSQLNQKLVGLGQAEYDRLWKLLNTVGKNNTDQAKRAIDEVTAALERQNAEIHKTAPSFADASAAAEALGLDINRIGDGINQLRVSDTAKDIAANWAVLRDAGANMEEVATGAAGKFQTLVDEALKWGHTLPEEMREPLQKMIDLGLLTDKSGDKLEDLSGIKWAEPMEKAVDRLIGKMDQLIDRIGNGLGGALSSLPDSIGDGWARTDRSGEVESAGANSFAGGTGGFRNFGRGQLAMLHGWEAVIRPGDLRQGGASQAGGTVILQVGTRELVRTLMPEIAGEVKRLRLGA